jgi:tetratricopeptide (TPR) repeat protein
VWGRESLIRHSVWRDALTFWETAAAASPQAGFPYAELGIQYARQGRYSEAERAFKTAVPITSIPEEQVRLRSNLGNLYMAQGRFSEADETLKTALAQDPSNDEVLWHLAELYFAMSVREKESTPKGIRVIAYDPALFLEAEGFLERALAIRPYLPLYLSAGKIYWEFGKEASAREYFEKVIQLSSNESNQVVREAREYLEHLENPAGP